MLYYIFAVAALYIVLSDSVVYWYEGVILLFLYIVYALIVSFWPKISKFLKIPGTTIPAQEIEEKEAEAVDLSTQSWNIKNLVPKLMSFVFFKLHHKLKTIPTAYNVLMAIFIVVVSSYYMVDFAAKLAEGWGIPAVIIGLTILAAGTSVPDLLASIKTAKDGYGDTAVTNAVGSNVFDVLGNLGLTWVVSAIFTAGKPISIDTDNLTGSIVLLVASSAALIIVLIGSKFNLNKLTSGLLMFSYLSYVVYICLHAMKVVG
ncbi:MAG: hypothetical protein WCK98_07880 [bacterium]